MAGVQENESGSWNGVGGDEGRDGVTGEREIGEGGSDVGRAEREVGDEQGNAGERRTRGGGSEGEERWNGEEIDLGNHPWTRRHPTEVI